MSTFNINYTSLDADNKSLAQCAILPWDSDYFGFKVGTLTLGTGAEQSPDHLSQALAQWMEREELELVSAQVPGDDFASIGNLSRTGFIFVDLALVAHLRRLDRVPPPRLEVRLAADWETEPLVEIAGQAFKFGRYHADARFPRQLADDRYRHWVRNAISARSPSEFIYVCGPQGSPSGFIHAKIEDTVADLRLAAIDAEQSTAFTGESLFSGALRHLAAAGARSAKAQLSAANTPIVNLYSSLGFTFQLPRIVFHRHAPNAKHLLPASQNLATS